MRPEWIRSLIHCRAHHNPNKHKSQLPFELCQQKMREKFGPGMNLDSDQLRYRWDQHIRSALSKHFRPVHHLNRRARVPAQGSQQPAQSGNVVSERVHLDAHGRPQGSFQPDHALSYGAPQPGANPSYGGSQSGHGGWHGAQDFGHIGPFRAPHQVHGGQQGAPHPAFHSDSSGGSRYGSYEGQSGAFQQGPGGPYPNTQGTNQQPQWPASSDPRSENRLPPIQSFDQLPGNRMPLPAESSHPMAGTDTYGNEASQSMAPGMQEPVTFYRTVQTSGSNRQFRFTDDQKRWLLGEGMYVDEDERTWEDVHNDFVANFPGTGPADNGPSANRLKYQFNKMRSIN